MCVCNMAFLFSSLHYIKHVFNPASGDNFHNVNVAMGIHFSQRILCQTNEVVSVT